MAVASEQGAGGRSGGRDAMAASRGEPTCLLAVDPRKGLALLEVHPKSGERERADVSRCVVFDGIALGPGVLGDAADRRIRAREEHLPLVAERVRGVFLRDLHRKDLGAGVGVVAAARFEAGKVRFTGDVRLAPSPRERTGMLHPPRRFGRCSRPASRLSRRVATK